jgi:uncharacterized protein YbjT (DUF2867 family)
MKVLIIGANGQIGQRIIKQLKNSSHHALAMVRKEDQRHALEAMGAKTVVADLEGDLGKAFESKPDAVIFTAGSGGHTGPEKTTAIDLQGAKKSIDEAVKHGAKRFIMISALGTNRAEEMSKDMQHYFRAKSEADQHLVHSNLDYTILRPGMLTDESGTGSLNAAEKLEDYGDMKISRDNVATAAVASLDEAKTVQKVIEMLDGPTPVKDALASV